MTPSQLRRRIAKDYQGRVLPRYRTQLLMRDDADLMRMYEAVMEAKKRKVPLSGVLSRLGRICTYDQLKALARLFTKERRCPPPPGGNGAWTAQPRREDAKFVAAGDGYLDPPLDRAAIRQRWIADGVAPETADRWLDEMGAAEGLG